jgi:hypothetical protein
MTKPFQSLPPLDLFGDHQLAADPALHQELFQIQARHVEPVGLRGGYHGDVAGFLEEKRCFSHSVALFEVVPRALHASLVASPDNGFALVENVEGWIGLSLPVDDVSRSIMG